MSEVEFLAYPEWDPQVENQISVVVNNTMLVQQLMPGNSGLEDIRRSMHRLADAAAELTHPVLSPGG